MNKFIREFYKEFKSTIEEYYYDQLCDNLRNKGIIEPEGQIKKTKLNKVIKYYITRDMGLKTKRKVNLDINVFKKGLIKNKVYQQTISEIIEEMSIEYIVYPTRSAIDEFLLDNKEYIQKLANSD
jgi:hypothetical protein